jgi:drug/metabolite transporter (DMT)-like permease
MRQPHKTSSLLDYSLIAVLGILLGIPYALTKITQTTIPPLTGVVARVLLAAIALWIVVLVSKVKLGSLKGYLPLLFVQGCLSCVIPYALIAYGQLSVDSALAAILNSTTPLFVCLISLLWVRQELLSFNRLLGVSAGLVGVIIIAGVNSLHGLGKDTLGQTAIILATACSAVAAIQGRRLNNIAPGLAAAGTLTFGAIVLVPLSFIVDAPLHVAPSRGSIIALLINAFLATALRSVIYFRLLRTIGSMGTTSAGYLKPAVGVLIGCTILGESLTWVAMIGFLAIFVGVAMINRREPLQRLIQSMHRRLQGEFAVRRAPVRVPSSN